MRTILLCALLNLPGAAARAQDLSGPDAAGTAAARPSDDELVNGVAQKLQSDPAAADALARRIDGTRISGLISQGAPGARYDDIRRWIQGDPKSAAGVAVGLAKDQANGDHRFEDMVIQGAKTNQGHFEFNPESRKGIYGNLSKSSKDSKLMRKDETMADEEQREILKAMFEGQGAQSNRIITQEEKGGKSPPGSGSASFNSGFYDRFGSGNLRGYSPQLQAMQSSLNARRVPGAPKLIETGKLDYDTLSYPGYSMRYDIANLETHLRYERNLAMAKLLGREREFTAEQLLDPAVEASLKAQAASKGPLNPRFAKRQAALERAAAAVKDFDVAALPSKDPLRITRALLLSLGDKQKEAARWITDASLQEELQRLEALEGFLSPELLAVIAKTPIDAASQASYKRRGEELLKTLKILKGNDEGASALLETDGWLNSIGRIEALLDQNVDLRKDLTRNIDDYVKVPYRLAGTVVAKPRWRELLDSLILRLLPGSDYARQLRGQAGAREVLRDVFVKIAQGNLEAAHTILSSYEPSGGPPSRR